MAQDFRFFAIIEARKDQTMTNLRIRLLFLNLGLAAAVALPVLSQEKKARQLDYDISVRAITLAVTVQEKGGKYINDLTQADFTVTENGAKQAITYFSHNSDAPLSLTILLDVSGSMAINDKLTESKAALRDFLTSSTGTKDEISLLIFADGEVEVASGFTNDRSGILAILDRTEAFGKTALNDAVAVSPEFASKGKNEKRALLLVTDGIENDSQSSPEQALEIARRVDVPIYTIGYDIPLGEQLLAKYKRNSAATSAGMIATLDRFSQATGGRAFFVDAPEELRAALFEIKKELSHQYIIGYTSYVSADDEYRRIQLTAKKKKYKVRARQGY
jgi:Ca-activated chloride channel homolog